MWVHKIVCEYVAYGPSLAAITLLPRLHKRSKQYLLEEWMPSVVVLKTIWFLYRLYGSLDLYFKAIGGALLVYLKMKDNSNMEEHLKRYRHLNWILLASINSPRTSIYMHFIRWLLKTIYILCYFSVKTINKKTNFLSVYCYFLRFCFIFWLCWSFSLTLCSHFSL